MKRIFSWLFTYLLPLFIIGIVVGGCVGFLINKIPTDEIDLKTKISTEKVLISNEMLLTDTMGKSLNKNNVKVGASGYYEFEICSSDDKEVKYDVLIDRESVDIEVPLKFIKIYLTDDNDNPIKGFDEANIPTFYSLKVSNTNPSAKVVYSGAIDAGDTVKFKLRMWVADTFELTSEEYIFAGKIMIKVK